MPDFPVAIRPMDSVVLSPASPQSIGRDLSGMGISAATAGWPAANRAIFMPITIYNPITVVKMFIENGASTSGNIDVGIYDSDGAIIVSSGSTAQSGVSATQEFDITDTLLNPGLYYLAAAMDNTTGTVLRWGLSGAVARGIGVAQMASAFPLPSTATFAALASSFIPGVFATLRSVI